LADSLQVLPHPRWRDIASEGRGRLTLGLALVELLAGIQSLIVVAIMPRVLGDLGGLQFYGLVFSGYMLSGLVSIPLAGRDADRHGPVRPFVKMIGVFLVGTVLASAAPSMPLLALARLVQGYGGGALYTIGYGVVAKAYPRAVRPRMIAMLTAVWVFSGLIGPGFGALIAETVGWRWAFISILPVAVLALWLVAPGLAGLTSSTEVAAIPLRWPLMLTLGAGLFLGGLSWTTWWGPIVAAAGIGVIVVALPRLLPAGTFGLRPGLPAAVALAFLLNVAFMTADSFVTLLLTSLRGRSLAEAGVAVTLVSISWAAGSWWQARVAATWSPRDLVTLGSIILFVGTAGFATALFGAPLLLAYAAWTIAGAGMGVAYSTALLASMDASGRGDETRVMAARFISGRLGIILGTGLGGASIALADAAGAPVSTGLTGVYSLALAAAAASVVASRRL
jgi:MFS family permease